MDSDKNSPVYSVQEFHARWSKSRISAFRQVAPPGTLISSSNEFELVDRYFSKDLDLTSAEVAKRKDALLRAVFDNSRLLALSLSKHLNLSFEVQDFQNLLEKSEIPCAQGQWESRGTARVLVRTGCEACHESGANACDYWREALDGLVMGLGDKERVVRHASVRHGDAACVDVFYLDGDGRKNAELAWGPLPEHMVENIAAVCSDFEHYMKTSVQIKGFNEGVLFFEFKSSTDGLCIGGQLLTSTFQRKIQKLYPGLLVREITPKAVLGVEK